MITDMMNHPDFAQRDTSSLRAIGGGIYLVGVVMMGYNLMMTAKQGKVTPTTIAPEAVDIAEEKEAK